MGLVITHTIGWPSDPMRLEPAGCLQYTTVAVDEFALQIGGDEVYAADVASIARGICEETTLENYWQIY